MNEMIFYRISYIFPLLPDTFGAIPFKTGYFLNQKNHNLYQISFKKKGAPNTLILNVKEVKKNLNNF